MTDYVVPCGTKAERTAGGTQLRAGIGFGGRGVGGAKAGGRRQKGMSGACEAGMLPFVWPSMIGRIRPTLAARLSGAPPQTLTFHPAPPWTAEGLRVAVANPTGVRHRQPSPRCTSTGQSASGFVL
jgi:hypothetical protein